MEKPWLALRSSSLVHQGNEYPATIAGKGRMANLRFLASYSGESTDELISMSVDCGCSVCNTLPERSRSNREGS
jgi:hypothetical protein